MIVHYTAEALWQTLVKRMFSAYIGCHSFPEGWRSRAESLLLWRGENVELRDDDRIVRGWLSAQGLGGIAAGLIGVQLYTANFLSDRTGKGGAHYGPFGGFCLETQYFPNAFANPNFPQPILKKGDTWKAQTVYVLGQKD